MAQPVVLPVTEPVLPEFAEFLHEHLQRKRSAKDWEIALRHQWSTAVPNYGFMLRSDSGAIVGGIGAYYADRQVAGEIERFCNITSWCVLDEYRQLSMKLAMAIINQPGYHFTDFSPTKVVGNTLKFFKFKELDEVQYVKLNLPAFPLSKARLTQNPSDINAILTGEALKIYRDHSEFPWLRHLVLEKGRELCHIIYRRRIFKKLPAASILYLSDRQVFSGSLHLVSGYFLARGMMTLHIERRMIDQIPWPSVVRSGFNRKVYLSKTLTDSDIDYLYSEQMALNL